MKSKFYISIVFLILVLNSCSNEIIDNTDEILSNAVSSESLNSDTNLENSSYYTENSSIILDIPEFSEPSYTIYTEYFIQGNINVQYPQIEGLSDKVLEQSINDFIETELFKIKIDEQLKEVQKTIEHGVDDDYNLILEYNITMYTDELMSILYTDRGSYNTSQYPTDGVMGLTIDMKTGQKLKLSDFIQIDKNLIDKLKNSDNICNDALLKENMPKGEFIKVVQDELEHNSNFIIEVLHGELENLYTFAVSPNSLFISIIILHAAGDYALIEVPYDFIYYYNK